MGGAKTNTRSARPPAATVRVRRPPGPAVPAAADGVAGDEMDYLFEGGQPATAPAVKPAAVSDPTPRDAGRAVGEALVQSHLAGLADHAVRAALAEKLSRLLPDLSPDRQDRVTGLAVRTLEQLARDHITRVRVALATAIKDIACAPPAVVNTLARDVERSVAEPVLRCCAALSETDLLRIIAQRGESWALSAVAGRTEVSAPVSEAIAAHGDTAATGVLLDNSGAVIAEPTLERLVEDSAERREWQSKLARRPSLPRRLGLRLAAFVDRSVLEMLKERSDFDPATAAEIAAAMRRRVDWVEARDPAETPERRALRLHRCGRLDEIAIGDALSWEEVDFVRKALALRASVPQATVDEILTSRSARAVTALVWRAGLSMRAAMQIQARAAAIDPRSMLNARRGTDFPLSAHDMALTLALYGIEV